MSAATDTQPHALPPPRGSEEYPSACVLSHCVWPYESGEVIVQNYNTLLTLATLLDAADGVLIVQNEALHDAAKTLLHIARRAGGAQRATVWLSGRSCRAR